MTYLPLDNNQFPIQVLRLKSTGGAHSIAATATTARNSTAFDAKTRVVSVYATGNVYMRFGDNTIAAVNTDHFFPAGVYYDFAIGDGERVAHYTNLAVLRADASDCVVYVSEKK